MILFIDHYDSFSFNLIAWLAESGQEIYHAYCDEEEKISSFLCKNIPIFLSPGPKRPDDYPFSMEVVRSARGKVPVFGVCLGHQMICQIFGGNLVSGPKIQHGTTTKVDFKNSDQLIYSKHEVTVYNSLIIERGSIPESAITYSTSEGEVYGADFDSGNGMVFSGVQFHPESFLSSNDVPWQKHVLQLVRQHNLRS